MRRVAIGRTVEARTIATDEEVLKVTRQLGRRERFDPNAMRLRNEATMALARGWRLQITVTVNALPQRRALPHI